MWQSIIKARGNKGVDPGGDTRRMRGELNASIWYTKINNILQKLNISPKIINNDQIKISSTNLKFFFNLISEISYLFGEIFI